MILVVGGHSRNVGKTSVVAGLIRGLPERQWTAIKITQFGHGLCTANGEACACETDLDHPYALLHETSATSGTDTARYLAAGARESIWLRTRQGELGFAMTALKRILERAENVVMESNSVLQFVRPDCYLVVMAPGVADFKPSSLRFLDRADALLVNGAEAVPEWDGVARRLVAGKPVFALGEGITPTREILEFVERAGDKVSANA